VHHCFARRHHGEDAWGTRDWKFPPWLIRIGKSSLLPCPELHVLQYVLSKLWTNDSFKEKTYHTYTVYALNYIHALRIWSRTLSSTSPWALFGKSNSGHRHLRSFRHSPLQSRTTDRSPPWASRLKYRRPLFNHV
jgi:hypothetical protein